MSKSMEMYRTPESGIHNLSLLSSVDIDLQRKNASLGHLSNRMVRNKIRFYRYDNSH